nr:reverse transcriptase domain-containing protein [Tanacetum cinerariifolium]
MVRPALRVLSHSWLDVTHATDYSFVDTVDVSIYAFESRAMTTVSLLMRERRYFRSMASSYEREAADAHRAVWIFCHLLAILYGMLSTMGVATALAEYEATRGSGNGDDSHDSRTEGRRQMPTTRECTYNDFLKCQPLNFKGNEGVVESDEVEKYVGGLLDMIQKSVMASKPKKMQDAIEFATELMDQKICTFADRQAESKRKLDDNSRSNQNQQQPFKRQNVTKAYTAGTGVIPRQWRKHENAT